MLACTHELGSDCLCLRFKCFQNITSEERDSILSNFNKMTSVNEQNSYLAGLVIVNTIAQRRPRQEEVCAKLHEKSHSY